MIKLLHYRKLPVLALFLSLLFLGGTAMGQTLYRSNATGAWNVLGTWQVSTDNGVTWGAAAAIPSNTNNDGITVRSPNIVTVSDNRTADQVIIETGAQVTVAAGNTWTIAAGVGVDLTVNGTILNQGTITPTGTIEMNGGSVYRHNQGTGTIITNTTWDPNSTLEFSNGGTTSPAAIVAGNTALGKILVTNNTIANISGGGGTGQILTVNNGTGDDLVVNAGSTLSVALNMDNFVLAAGAAANISGTFTSNVAYNTSAAGAVTTVNGLLVNSNTLSNFGAAANLVIAGTGTFRHGINFATIPTATWNSGSTLSITGITNIVPTIPASGPTNLTWDCAGQNNLALNQSISLPGNLTINNTGGKTLFLTNAATSQTLSVGGTFNITGTSEFYGSTVGTGNATITAANYFQSGTNSQFIIANGPNALVSTMTISGTFNQTAGDFQVVNGNGNGTLTVDGNMSVGTGAPEFRVSRGGGNATVNVGGNFTQGGTSTVTFKEDAGNAVMNITGNFLQSGGTFRQREDATGTSNVTVTGDFSRTGGTYNLSAAAAASTLTVTGDFSNTAGDFTTGAAGSNVGNVVFNGSTPQVFTSGATVTNNVNYTVNTGATLQMAVAGTVVNGASFTLQPDATLGIRAADGIATAGAAGNIRTTARTFPVTANYLYNGTALQTTLGTGFPTGLTGDLIINNTAGVTLAAARTIASGGKVELRGGNFIAGAGLLNLAAGSLIERSAGTMTGTIDAASGVYNVLYTGVEKTTGPELQGGNAGVNKLGNLEIALSTSGNRVNIGAPFELTGNLTFTLGKLAAGAPPNVLTMTEAATHSGAGPNAHYLGGMIKRGTAAFVFPIGSGSGGYRPVAFSGSATAIGAALSATATVEAQSLGLNPLKTIAPKTFFGTLESLTTCYYWNLNRLDAGASAIYVWGSTGTGGGPFATDFLRSCMVDVPPISFPPIDPAELVVAKHDGGWLDLGQGAQAESDGAWFISAATATPGFSPFAIGSAEGVLPVTLTSFTATKNGDAVKLSWETASEQNSAYFDVERSADGVNFSSIGKVNAAGNSSTAQKYNFTDNNPAGGRNFYRLRQVDLDAQYEYSKTVSVNMAANAAVNLYPNPVQNNVMVEYPKVGKGATYRVVAMDGRVMQTGVLQENSTQQNISLGNLQRGQYILTINNNGQQYNQKVVKQ